MKRIVETNGTRQDWSRIVAAFLILFILYQAAEVTQTVLAPKSPMGPALMLGALILAWPLGRWLSARGFDAFGLSVSAESMKVLAAGLLLAGLAKLAALSLGLALSVYGPSATAPGGLSRIAVAGAALVTFVPSLTEDILTRGFLLRAIPIRLGLTSYALVSATLYTVNHVWRFNWGPSEQVRLFCLGLAYGAAAWRWQTLWAAVALHWGWNFSNQLTELGVPLDTLDRVAGRYVSAVAHLALLGLVVLLPPRQQQKR